MECEYGLLSLPDDLLVQVLQHVGAKAVACAATCCRRLRRQQAALAQRPAFASALIFVNWSDAATSAKSAVDSALASLPAAVDFALLFVANLPPRHPDPLPGMLETVSSSLPPGTKVVGCTGRGVFGVLSDGTPAEIDPAASVGGVSLLLGRLPGVEVHTFATNRPTSGWGSEAACRAWLGLPAELEPLSLSLFTLNTCTHLLDQCLEGLGAAFPQMVITGGVASGPRRREVIAVTASGSPSPPAAPNPVVAAPAPAAPSSAGRELRSARRAAEAAQENANAATAVPAAGPCALNAAAKKMCCGLVLCARKPAAGGIPAAGVSPRAGPGGRPVRLGAFTTRGMMGVEPPFSGLQLNRGEGYIETGSGETLEMFSIEAPGRASAQRTLADLVDRYGHADIALWAAERSGGAAGGATAHTERGGEVVVLEAMAHGDSVLGAADPRQEGDLEAILKAADQPGHTLCGQLLALAPAGYTRDIASQVPALVGDAAAATTAGGAQLGPGAHTSGLLVVSCTAKGRQVFKKEGVEAAAIFAASQGAPMAGVFADGEIGPAGRMGAACRVRWGGAAGAGTELQGFTTIVSAFSG